MHAVEDTIMIDPSSAVTPIVSALTCQLTITAMREVTPSKLKSSSLRDLVNLHDSELTNTTSNYTLEDYKTCARIVADTICYSTVIFHNELELGRTERQKL